MQILEFVHKALSPVLYGLGIYQWQWQRQSKDKACIAVLYYHRIVACQEVNKGLLADEVGIAADVFEKHMQFMLKHFTPIKPSEIVDVLNKPGLYFTVTFDDGFEDNYSVAAPILSKLGISGGFYVVSDFVGTDKLFWWEQLAYLLKNTECKSLDASQLCTEWNDLEPLILLNNEQKNHAQRQLAKALRQTPAKLVPDIMQALSKQLEVELISTGRSHPLMNWKQLKELNNCGFDIGGHTANHVNLGKTESSEHHHEIFDATETLRSSLNDPIITFAYPYGSVSHYTDDSTQAVIDVGYHCAFTTTHGIVTRDSHRYRLPRFKLNKSWPFTCAYNVANAFNGK
ncbi:polysaccharide deacetylase family protein [Aliiglaciecola litoralis]|uniref:NodB homology domain-containing protein n=1 Tax=Aliiglaciecola litoralis TaxID=582857 RepID=A0ABN1LIF9_9ALTE